MDSLLLWQQANFSLYVSAATLLYQSYLITRLNYPKIVFNISPSLDQILLNESLHNRQLTIDGLTKKKPLLFEPSTAERTHEISKHLFLLTETVFKHGTLHVHFLLPLCL